MTDSQESNLRSEIVAACRKLDRKNLITATGGNVSCRAGEDCILITPRGVPKADLRPEELISASLDGKLHAGVGRPSSEMGMHLQVYQKRPDVGAVVHAHPPVATALTLAGIKFNSKVLPESWLMLGRVPTAPYATPSTDELTRSIDPYIEGHRAILLHRHGAITFGRTVAESLERMEELEHAARVLYYAAMLEGRKSPAAMAESEIERLEQAFRMG